jgi:F-box/leucine-rich repeat protein 4
MNDEQVGFNLADLKKLCNSYIDYTRTYMDQRNTLGRIDEEPSALDYDFVFQFSSEVVDFSSQYGSDISISYTASNLIGRPSKFPNYGDFPQSYVMVSPPYRRLLLGCALTLQRFFSIIDSLTLPEVSCHHSSVHESIGSL